MPELGTEVEAMDRIEQTARMVAQGRCTLGDARTCAMSGDSVVCRSCGWRAAEIERRRTLPLTLNRDGRWQKKVGVRKA